MKRRSARWNFPGPWWYGTFMLRKVLAATVAILLALVSVAAGLHHHADRGEHDNCALCAVAHAPFILVAGITLAAAPSLAPAVQVAPAPEPRTADRNASAPPRAPPAA